VALADTNSVANSAGGGMIVTGDIADGDTLICEVVGCITVAADVVFVRTAEAESFLVTADGEVVIDFMTPVVWKTRVLAFPELTANAPC